MSVWVWEEEKRGKSGQDVSEWERGKMWMSDDVQLKIVWLILLQNTLFI